jgi:hypothetical protein
MYSTYLVLQGTPLFVSRALKSVLVDLSLPKRRALFDFLRDPQFVKSKLTYLFLRTAKRPWTDWHGWNSTIILDFGATSIKWVSRHETMSTKTRCVHKDGQIRSLCFFQKMSLTRGGGFVNPDFARNCESVNAQSPMTEGATIFELNFKANLNYALKLNRTKPKKQK